MNLQIILAPLAPGIEKPPRVCRMRGHIGSGKRALDAITAHLKLKIFFFLALGCMESPQSGGLILAVAGRTTEREEIGGKSFKGALHLCGPDCGV